MVHIKDNFLEKEVFTGLQGLLLGFDFPWYYNKDVVDEGEDTGSFQFTHMFYKLDAPHSEGYKTLIPIINELNLLSLLRIKANLQTKTPTLVKHTFHQDAEGVAVEKLKQWTNAIFYVNTNNGYTEFEDGTKVDSVANRLVTFPADIKHRGTSCTDEKTRVVINFNYYSR